MSELAPRITHNEPLVPLPTDEADLARNVAEDKIVDFVKQVYGR